MSKETEESWDFFACIPHQIEADWDEKWGPPLEGFPLNILYIGITNNKQESSATPSSTTTSEPEVEDYYPEDETCFVIVGGIRPKKKEKERLPTGTRRPCVQVCYWPDLATFHEDSEHKEMWYFTKPNNGYWIRVAFDRKNRAMADRKVQRRHADSQRVRLYIRPGDDSHDYGRPRAG